MHEIDIIAILKAVWRKRKNIIKWATIGFIIGAIVAFSIPNTYSSFIKIAPEEGSKGVSGSAGAFASMMGMNTEASDNGVNKAIYKDIIESSPFVMEFADINVINSQKEIPLWHYLDKEQKKAWWSYIFGAPISALNWVISLFGNSQEKQSDIHTDYKKQDAFIKKLSSSVVYNSDKKTGVITITTTFQDPIIATIVADSMLVKLQKYITRYRTQKTRQTLESNIVMMEQAKENLYKLDENYASSADKNQNLISEKAKMKLERIQNEKELAFQVYQKLALQVATDRIKLQEDIPIATVIEPARVPVLKSAPNKKMIIVGFVFLFILGASSVIAFKEIKTYSK